MKICVSASADSLDAFVDPRFARCTYFVIVNLEDMSFEAIRNPASETMGGAGIQAAQLMASKNVKVVITGNVGPNAYQALSAAGIKFLTRSHGTVREVIEKYKKGELKEISPQPSVDILEQAWGEGEAYDGDTS